MDISNSENVDLNSKWTTGKFWNLTIPFFGFLILILFPLSGKASEVFYAIMFGLSYILYFSSEGNKKVLGRLLIFNIALLINCVICFEGIDGRFEFSILPHLFANNDHAAMLMLGYLIFICLYVLYFLYYRHKTLNK